MVEGRADAPFASVRAAFEKNFDDGLELGAGFVVCIDGEIVIKLCGGFEDKACKTPWRDDTIACVYSSGKAVLTLLVARAASDGALSYDAPAADYWPEFGAQGKERITVGELLSHQGGLCGIPDAMAPEDWIDWRVITKRLETMAPLWPPGSANGYHPQTFGFLAGELLRRTVGRSPGEIIRADFAEKFELPIFCGMTPEETTRAAYMRKPPRPPDLGEINRYTELAFLKPWSAPARVSREAWAAAEIPASNMHASARALAEVVQPLANGGMFRGEKILAAAAIDAALGERIRGDDLVLPFHLAWTPGLMKNINGHFGPSTHAYGHAGFGGSCVVIDPENRLTAAYVMNKMSPHLAGDPRAVRLLDAVYDCL
ncbi:MAG: serine hydrolase domain-containing protein [Parvularculaceae bacterium]